jgi:hypothetical protein
MIAGLDLLRLGAVQAELKNPLRARCAIVPRWFGQLEAIAKWMPRTLARSTHAGAELEQVEADGGSHIGELGIAPRQGRGASYNLDALGFLRESSRSRCCTTNFADSRPRCAQVFEKSLRNTVLTFIPFSGSNYFAAPSPV